MIYASILNMFMIITSDYIEENDLYLLLQISNTETVKMGDRFNILSQMEHLQSKYMGTGHADSTKFEWAAHQHRDTFSSLMGHQDLTNYLAVAENESKARVKFNMLEKMLQPCGPPPEKKYED